MPPKKKGAPPNPIRAGLDSVSYLLGDGKMTPLRVFKSKAEREKLESLFLIPLSEERGGFYGLVQLIVL